MGDKSEDKWRAQPLEFKLDMLKNIDRMVELQRQQIETMGELKRTLLHHWMKERVPEPQHVPAKWITGLWLAMENSKDKAEPKFHYDRKVWDIEEAQYCLDWIVPIHDRANQPIISIANHLKQMARRRKLSKQREEY